MSPRCRDNSEGYREKNVGISFSISVGKIRDTDTIFDVSCRVLSDDITYDIEQFASKFTLKKNIWVLTELSHFCAMAATPTCAVIESKHFVFPFLYAPLCHDPDMCDGQQVHGTTLDSYDDDEHGGLCSYARDVLTVSCIPHALLVEKRQCASYRIPQYIAGYDMRHDVYIVRNSWRHR